MYCLIAKIQASLVIATTWLGNTANSLAHLSLVTRSRPNSQSTIPDRRRRQVIENDVIRDGQDRVVISSRTSDRALELFRTGVQDWVLEMTRHGGWSRDGRQQLLQILLILVESALSHPFRRLVFAALFDRDEVDERRRNNICPERAIICFEK